MGYFGSDLFFWPNPYDAVSILLQLSQAFLTKDKAIEDNCRFTFPIDLTFANKTFRLHRILLCGILY
jgi:hypothetical protein